MDVLNNKNKTVVPMMANIVIVPNDLFLPNLKTNTQSRSCPTSS